MKKILGVSKGSFWIYLVGLILSGVSIRVYFIEPENCVLTVLMSIGASLVGAIVLAYFIELSNNKVQQKNKDEVRRTKTILLLRQAGFVFERTVWYYFRLLFDVLHKENKDKCHRITYQELWEELSRVSQEIFNQFNANEEYSFEDYTAYQQLNEIIVGYYKSLIVYVEDIEKDIGVFEAAGYFSHEETNTISAIKNLLSSINVSNDAFKNVFELIIDLRVEEARSIQYLPYYWKDGEVARLDRAFKKNMKLDDTMNTIHSCQRKFG